MMEKDSGEEISTQAKSGRGPVGASYWETLEEWRNDPQFFAAAEKEFLSTPFADEETGIAGGWARRDFLKLMGASLALSSFGCARRPAQKIVPYAKQPPEVIGGIPNYYASSWVDGYQGFGIVVKTREGRPIKIEGNPLHPTNAGGMSARAHAHILELYDPDRLRGPYKNLVSEKRTSFETVSSDWEKIDAEIVAQLKKGGVAILTGSEFSPSGNALLSQFAAGTGAQVYTWDPITYEAVSQAQKICYGTDVLPRYRLDKAKKIVSIGADILGTYLSPVTFQRDFSAGRTPSADMNQLIVFEGLLSLTGANADRRVQVRPSQYLTVAMGLLYEVIVKQQHSVFSSDEVVKRALAPYGQAAQQLGLDPQVFSEIAEELWRSRGQCLVMAGGVTAQTGSETDLQVVVNLLNSALENDGRTIDYQRGVYSGRRGSQTELRDLEKRLVDGQIKTVIVHGLNVGYNAPGSFIEALKKAERIVYTGARSDETARLSNWLVPDHHPLEDWGDLEVNSGIVSLQQPTIQPLHNTRSFKDSLLIWGQALGVKSLADQTNWYGFLRGYWQNEVYRRFGKGEGFEEFWLSILSEGTVAGKGATGDAPLAPRRFSVAASAGIRPPSPVAADFELALYSSVALADGTLGNVAWLQELPDPVTKICWDNYVTVSLATAEKEKLKEGDLVDLKLAGGSLRAPIHIQPGQADGVLGLALGYGQKNGGRVNAEVGVNAYALSVWEDGKRVFSGLPAGLKRTGRRTQLANVAGYHSMKGPFDSKPRTIVIEATTREFLNSPSAGIHRHKTPSLWEPQPYKGRKWAMTVDLSRCTGCSACVVACQSENNIPTVGKKYVLQGREMHWMRIDRYYVGDAKDPDSVHMPVLCQHCDNAPCETVCPVIATVHGPEGTNDMIYNRCVGTRYCANNCPYKVRRFNWFNYTKMASPLNLALNPEVTVRSRGVMEKCTFCIHRVAESKQLARNEGRDLRDGDVQTACEQSCPSRAIVFGDVNDPQSRVSREFKNPRTYSLLEELNAQPAVRYQTKIRNSAQTKGGHHHEDHGKGGHA